MRIRNKFLRISPHVTTTFAPAPPPAAAVPSTKRYGTSFCARRTHAQVIATVISLMSSSLSSRSTVRFTPSVSVSSSSSSRPISNVVVFQQTVIV